MQKKEEILGLNDEKKKAYHAAYSYLNLAGQAEKYKNADPICDNKKINSFLPDIKEKSDIPLRRDFFFKNVLQ